MTDEEIRALFVGIQQARQNLIVFRETLLPILEEMQPAFDAVFSAIAMAQGEAVIRLINEKGMTPEQAIAIVTGSSHVVTSAVSGAVEQFKKVAN